MNDSFQSVVGEARPALREGDTCWRIARADRAALIVDAEEYFRHARAAMLRARRRIMLIGWDFDARIALAPEDSDDEGPRTIGAFIHWLVQRNPELEVYLLRWDIGALKTLFRGKTILTVLRWMLHPRIHTRLDGHHPPSASHHQKIVVIDDRFAFCGGIDMTGDRWDTRAHRDDDPRRVSPSGKPYGPWHDATTALSGPVATALADHARERWRRSGGARLAPVEGGAECWPEHLAPLVSGLDIAISRTAPVMPDEEPVLEIERLYVEQIARARRYIYAESQYFASRRIAEAIAARLDAPDCPEIVIVNPETANGWLEPIAMDSARARLVEALKRRDRSGRLRLYHPCTSAGAPIYVHAKILIADDEVLRVGSSNMNNRSLRLDTECDVTIDATLSGGDAAREAIRATRDGLLAEHLGCEAETVRATIAAKGSLIAAIEALRGPGRSLRPYETPQLSEVKAWLADNEVLDAEGPGALLEDMTKGGLLRRLRRGRRRR